MAFRFRKSVDLGALRINTTKSGIGYPISNVEKQEISDSVDADVVAKKTLKSISKAINKKL